MPQQETKNLYKMVVMVIFIETKSRPRSGKDEKYQKVLDWNAGVMLECRYALQWILTVDVLFRGGQRPLRQPQTNHQAC